MIDYKEFCRLLMPADRYQASQLLKRGPGDRMSYSTQEIFKRLLRAHLNVEQAHEYLRERFTKKCALENWRLEELFEVADSQNTNALSVYDIEKLIIEHRKCGSKSLMDDVELLFAMYDRSGHCKINYFDFKDQLVPLIN